MNDAWHVFTAQDRRLSAPPHLEARVLAAVAEAQRRAPSRPHHPLVTRTMAAAVMAAVLIGAVAIGMWPIASDPAETLIESRAFAAAPLPHAVEARRPRLRARAPGFTPIHSNRIAQHVEPPGILMMFEFAPIQPAEPMQLVRLRMPKEMLQGLGIALLEPDTAGTVDIDMLVGEDGLPRDIRRVRSAQEEP
jgi:hypothetical protein